VQSHYAQRARSPEKASARATTKIEKDTSSLKLKLRTAEGDSVEISIDARQIRQTERGYARGTEGRVAQRNRTESNSVTARVNVTGDLSEDELGDIQDLLASLSSGESPQAGEGDLDSISAYQFGYSRTHEVGRSTVGLFA
jgi:hypothetical protein